MSREFKIAVKKLRLKCASLIGDGTVSFTAEEGRLCSVGSVTRSQKRAGLQLRASSAAGEDAGEEEAGQPSDQRRLLPAVHSDAVLGICATDKPTELISASDDRVRRRFLCRALSGIASL